MARYLIQPTLCLSLLLPFFWGGPFFLGWISGPVLTAQDKQEGEKSEKALKEDPQVLVIGKAMALLARKPLPVSFSIRMVEDHPFEDAQVVAEGQLWAVGDKKLHFKLQVKVGRMEVSKQEVVINEKGAWLRFPLGGIIKFSPELWEKIQYMEKRNKAGMGTISSSSQLDIISGLKEQGFQLKWRGQKKLGTLVVDEIVGTRQAPGEAGASLSDPGGTFDRCVLLIGEKDRVLRRMEGFAGERRVRLLEYLDVKVGGKLPAGVFTFKPGPKDQVVAAQKHPILGDSLTQLLQDYDKLRQKEKQAKEDKAKKGKPKGPRKNN